MSAMSVRFLGVRGSFRSPGPDTIHYDGNTSGVGIRCGDEPLICDAGTGIRALDTELLATRRNAPFTATLLISHTRWDDTQFDAAEYAQRNGCVTDSVDLALAAGVQTLILFHHDPEHDDQKLEAMAMTARRRVASAGGILDVQIARERKRWLVSNRRALAAA